MLGISRATVERDWRTGPGLALSPPQGGPASPGRPDDDPGALPAGAGGGGGGAGPPRATRAAFLATACAGNDTLRAEVDSLLAAYDECGGTPSWKPPAAELGGRGPADRRRIPADDGLPAGTRLGAYEVVEPWGAAAWGSCTARCAPTTSTGSRRDQGHPSGDGHRGRRGAASARSARSWPASSTEHRAAPRRRRPPRRACPTSSWSTSRASRIDPTATAGGSSVARAAGASSASVRGRAPLRPPQPGGPPRPQAAQHPGHRRRRAQAARLRHRAPASVRTSDADAAPDGPVPAC